MHLRLAALTSPTPRPRLHVAYAFTSPTRSCLRHARALLVALALVALPAAPVAAQGAAQEAAGGAVEGGDAELAPAAATRVARLAQARRAAERAHLRRVAAWGGASLAGGLALALATARPERPGRWAFGAQTAAWGAVNVGIAAAGLLGTQGAAPTGYADALAAERTFHDLLVLNTGLNVAYMAVGTTMVIASYRDVASARGWRGHGRAVALQGLGLFVLDGVALFAARGRLAALLDVPGHLSAAPLPRGLALAWTL